MDSDLCEYGVEKHIDGPRVGKSLGLRSVHHHILVQRIGHVLEHDQGVGGGQGRQQRGGGGGQFGPRKHHQAEAGAHRPRQAHRDAHVAVHVGVAADRVIEGAAVGATAAVRHF